MSHSLYIHWPFCLAKCPYCDFNSHVRSSIDIDRWTINLLNDLRFEAETQSDQPLGSIFFGGGTPSLMPPSLVETLIAEAQRLWGFDTGIEITLEANPSSVEAAKFAALASAGINRVSLGIQSFEEEALRFLGRLHDAQEAMAALDVAQRHFARVSFDLIYARPGQSEQDWQAELTKAFSFGTEHLSLYQLTIEPGTRFATMVREGSFTPLDDDSAANLFSMTREMTAAAGLPAYEISNHSRPGCESRHNMNYWRYGDYFGIGPGAHGRRGGFATTRHRKPENWMEAVANNGHGMAEQRPLPPYEQAAEAMMMGLRLREGIDLAQLSARWNIPADHLHNSQKLDLYIRESLAWRNGTRIGATEQGMAVLDALLGELIPDQLAITPPT